MNLGALQVDSAVNELNQLITPFETEINQTHDLTLDQALELLANAISAKRNSEGTETYAVLTNSSLPTPQLEQACEELAFLTALCQHLSKAQL